MLRRAFLRRMARAAVACTLLELRPWELPEEWPEGMWSPDVRVYGGVDPGDAFHVEIRQYVQLFQTRRDRIGSFLILDKETVEKLNDL